MHNHKFSALAKNRVLPSALLAVLTISLPATAQISNAAADASSLHPPRIQSELLHGATPKLFETQAALPAADSSPSKTGANAGRKPGDINDDIYYRHRTEFSVESGWLPNNVPFVPLLLVGQEENFDDLHYRLAPILATVRWQITKVEGRWWWRGNWEMSFSGAYIMIARGPETRYWGHITGIRRNFVRPDLRFAPYLEGRAGLGDINAKGPYGVKHAQGQDFTFNLMLGLGVRYNFNSRYSISTGASYMHVSNLYLSEPEYVNDAINVYGVLTAFNIRLGGPRKIAGTSRASIDSSARHSR